MLIREPDQLVAARLERASHGVERVLERADLADAGLGHPRGDVPAGEPAGRDGGSANRPDDRPRQVTRVEEDEKDRAPDAGCGADDGAASGRVGAFLTRRTEVALGCDETVDWIRSASTRRLPSSVAATVVGEGSFRRAASTSGTE